MAWPRIAARAVARTMAFCPSFLAWISFMIINEMVTLQSTTYLDPDSSGLCWDLMQSGTLTAAPGETTPQLNYRVSRYRRTRTRSSCLVGCFPQPWALTTLAANPVSSANFILGPMNWGAAGCDNYPLPRSCGLPLDTTPSRRSPASRQSGLHHG